MQSTSINTTVSSLNNHNDTSTQQQIPKKGSSFIKILSMNRIKGNTKNCEFRELLQQHDPHVIVGCESKIDSTFPTYSLFPPHYTEVHRKDRTNLGGGVFCAIRGDILATEEKDLSMDNECVWSSIQLPQSQELYLGSFYRPPGAPLEHLEHPEKSLIELYTKCTRRHPNGIIAGHFNVGT